ncbi:MAG: YdeI/OmpD-associated family protein [Rhizobiales bacterium]|nr:YdeI/OmpD-associated family protein [Hyphomicrobiales bacterium]
MTATKISDAKTKSRPKARTVEPLEGGTVHTLPPDLANALRKNKAALATWRDITPLARNEWICWITSAKKAETREKRITWGCENLEAGKRRPCCWPGCKHR